MQKQKWCRRHHFHSNMTLAKVHLFSRETPAEFVNLTRRVNNLLLTGIKRMATCAYFNMQVFTRCRPRCKGVATAAMHSDIFVGRVDIRFHQFSQDVVKMGRESY
jgi:hypothetical protein